MSYDNFYIFYILCFKNNFINFQKEERRRREKEKHQCSPKSKTLYAIPMIFNHGLAHTLITNILSISQKIDIILIHSQ